MSINNETHGQTAEKVICDLSGLSNSQEKRSNPIYEEKLKLLISEALKELPKITKHSGLDRGSTGAQSKSSIDFNLEGNKTLSVKCFKSAPMACAPEVGQGSWAKLEKYYKDLLQKKNIKSFNADNYKLILYESIDEFVPIQLDHLFSCNFLLYIQLKKKDSFYKIISRKTYETKISNYSWKFENFSASKAGFNWTRSINYRYNNISIINAQLHDKRKGTMKFRFNLKNLSKIFNL